MPVIPFQILKSATVSYSLYKSAGLIAHRIMLLVSERPQWRIADIYPVGIYLELRSRSTVLKIIFSVMLRHISPFGKRTQRHFIIIVHAKPFPAMFFRTKHHYIIDLTDRTKIITTDLYAFKRVFITRTIIKIELTVIIQKQARIP